MNTEELLVEKWGNFKTRFGDVLSLMNEEQRSYLAATTVDHLHMFMCTPLAPLIRTTLQQAVEDKTKREDVLSTVASMASIPEQTLLTAYRTLPEEGMASKQMLWAYVEFFLKYLHDNSKK
jgi:hypothetical protein